MEKTDTLRIVLLGKTGSGKSSLGNTIFGDREYFRVNHSASSASKDLWDTFTRHVHGRTIQLTDTPGFFDTDHTSQLNPALLRFTTECAPGPHAFLFVFKMDKFTALEQALVEVIVQYFNEKALKYSTVVFTHGNDLPKGMMVKDWVNDNEVLKALVQKCGGRVHVFDNKYWNNSLDPYRNNQHQVEQLLKTIEKTVSGNEGGYYKNEMLQKNEIYKEKARILQLTPTGSSPSGRRFFSWITNWFSI